MKTKNGYTLVEILIAASILSVFLLSAFMVFRQLTMTYRVGEWRASRQKEMQIFLQNIKEDLEKANSAFMIGGNGEPALITELNVSVNSPAFNDEASGTKAMKSDGSNKPVAYFAIIKQAVEASAFSAELKGSWQGCSLGFQEKKLCYLRTGDHARHCAYPVAIPAGVNTVPSTGVSVGSVFEPNLANEYQKTVDDVDSIAFYLIEIGGKMALKVEISCKLDKAGLSNSSISESTVAKLLEDTKVVEVGM